MIIRLKKFQMKIINRILFHYLVSYADDAQLHEILVGPVKRENLERHTLIYFVRKSEYTI